MAEESGCRGILQATLVGLGLSTAVVGFALLQMKADRHHSSDVKWLSFAIITAIVFTQAVTANAALRRRLRFWLSLGLLLVVFTALGTVVLSRVDRVPAVVWGFSIAVGSLLVDALLLRLCSWQPPWNKGAHTGSR